MVVRAVPRELMARQVYSPYELTLTRDTVRIDSHRSSDNWLTLE
jgi:hypothetical protein